MDLCIKGILTIKNQGLFLIALPSSNAAFHSRLALARSPGASRDMNQEIYFIFIKMDIPEMCRMW
jgi:hypothetical protein